MGYSRSLRLFFCVFLYEINGIFFDVRFCFRGEFSKITLFVTTCWITQFFFATRPLYENVFVRGISTMTSVPCLSYFYIVRLWFGSTSRMRFAVRVRTRVCV